MLLSRSIGYKIVQKTICENVQRKDVAVVLGNDIVDSCSSFNVSHPPMIEFVMVSTTSLKMLHGITISRGNRCENLTAMFDVS